MKKVIITGGGGLIGRALGDLLLQKGYEALVLSRAPQKLRLPQGMRALKWDGSTPQGWQNEVEGAYAIVNLAGENIGAGRWTGERKKRIRSSRLEAGQAVTQAIAAAHNKPVVLLQASGIGYYGLLGDERVDEETQAGDDWLARLAVEWENSTAAVEEMGVRRVILRTGLVLARQGGTLSLIALPFRLFAGGALGNGRQYWSWIHLDDEAGAICFLMENQEARGAYNLTAPNPLPMAQFGRILAAVIRRPYWLPVPGFLLRLALGEMSALVLGGQRVFPMRLLSAGYSFKYADLQPALENLLSAARR